MNHEATSLSIDLTEGCTLRCGYCFTHSAEHAARVVDEGAARTAIDWAFSHKKPVSLTWWGGEPTMQMPLLQALSVYAIRKSITEGVPLELGMTTNGTLLTPENVAILRVLGITPLVSLDGGPENHNAYRPGADGLGSFGVVVAGIKELQKQGFFTMARATATPEFLYDLVYNARAMLDLGLDSVSWSPAYELNYDQISWSQYAVNMCTLWERVLPEIKEGRPCRLRRINMAIDDALNGVAQRTCAAGSTMLGMAVDGTLWPCHRFNKHGVARDTRWQIGEVTEREVRLDSTKIEEITKAARSPCSGCSKGCSTGCRAVNYDVMGDVRRNPDVACLEHEALKPVVESVLIDCLRNGIAPVRLPRRGPAGKRVLQAWDRVMMLRAGDQRLTERDVADMKELTGWL